MQHVWSLLYSLSNRRRKVAKGRSEEVGGIKSRIVWEKSHSLSSSLTSKMDMQFGGDLCFPHLFNTSCRKPKFSWTETVLLRTILSFISLLTVALNLLVIIAISHFRKLHTPTNILLLSLAVSDFLVGLLLMPGEIVRHTACWFFGDLVCSLYNYVSYVVTSASVGDMVLISADRYVAICDPLRYSAAVTERKVKVCVCLCWLSSVLYSSVIVNSDLTQPGQHNSCQGECVIVVDYILGTIDLVATFIAPVAVMVALYMRVFVAAVSQARALRSQVTAVSLQLSVSLPRKSELKAAWTLGVLMVVFLMCFCPYYCVSLAGGDLLTDSSVSYVIFLFYLNSSLNPVIYTLLYPWFRRATKLIVTFQILRPGSCEASIQ
ncbi:trace amine-associated receptor 1-like [Poeciliopsis prolifica]|uniref:trace amine-associated receptor 1-like n=1 Tax=Poeciliopsis prolifica TaxID=188132 RepID=UPI0024145977|nr:trace amine-associated receptor 1-like [Poeciliopsis prolifica]